MTAITPDLLDTSGLRPPSLTQVQRRLGELIQDSRGRASWWVDMARELDNLAESVTSAPGQLTDMESFLDQIRADAPHLMGRWQRLTGERDGLFDSVTEVRLLTGRYAGDPEAVSAISRAVREVLMRVRRFQDRASEVLLDVYERDIGGE
jgi:hypothetical protein